MAITAHNPIFSRPTGTTGHQPGRSHQARPLHRARAALRRLAWIGQTLLLLLLAAGARAEAMQVEVLTQAGRSWNGAALPAYPAGPPQVTVLRITVPAGSRLPLHQHPVINVAYLLRGALTVVSEAGPTRRLQAGEALVEVVGTWHYGVNEGSEPAELVVFYAGTTGQALSVVKPAQD